MGLIAGLIRVAPRFGLLKGLKGRLGGYGPKVVSGRFKDAGAAHGDIASGDVPAAHSCGPFDGFVNGLNRLPRPLLALSTLGLMGYAMADPAEFSLRMQGLAYVPEPLWWLMGVIVSFYFGAREAHYARGRALAKSVEGLAALPEVPRPDVRSGAGALTRYADNAALRDWATFGG